jgi:hypothetical protein
MAKHVCPVCGKQLKTEQGLRDHRRTHSGGQKQKSKPAPLSTPTGAGPSIDGVVTISGRDRVFTETKIFEDGHIAATIPIFTGMSTRLGRIASAFTRINWISLTFEIDPKCAATTAGGYVAGFVPDPLDDNISLASLTSTKGAQSKKWWESSKFMISLPKVSMFTEEHENPRLSSPGIFYVLVDGPTGDSVTLTVTATWRVKLSQPTTEEPQVGPPRIVELLTDSNITAQGIVSAKKVSELTGHLYPDGTIFYVPRYIVEWTEGSGDEGTKIYSHVKVTSSDKAKAGFWKSSDEGPGGIWYDAPLWTAPEQAVFLKHDVWRVLYPESFAATGANGSRVRRPVVSYQGGYKSATHLSRGAGHNTPKHPW